MVVDVVVVVTRSTTDDASGSRKVAPPQDDVRAATTVEMARTRRTLTSRSDASTRCEYKVYEHASCIERIRNEGWLVLPFDPAGTNRNSNQRQEPNDYQHWYPRGRPIAVCDVSLDLRNSRRLTNGG